MSLSQVRATNSEINNNTTYFRPAGYRYFTLLALVNLKGRGSAFPTVGLLDHPGPYSGCLRMTFLRDHSGSRVRDIPVLARGRRDREIGAKNLTYKLTCLVGDKRDSGHSAYPFDVA